MSKASEQKHRHAMYPSMNKKTFISKKDYDKWNASSRQSLVKKQPQKKAVSIKRKTTTRDSWFESEAKKNSTKKPTITRDKYGRITSSHM